MARRAEGQSSEAGGCGSVVLAVLITIGGYKFYVDSGINLWSEISRVIGRTADCPPEWGGGTYGLAFLERPVWEEKYGEGVTAWEGLVRAAVDEFIRTVDVACLPRDPLAWKEQIVEDMLAMISIESGGNPDAVGGVGEVGLTQLTPKYYEHLVPPGRRLIDPDVNIGIATARLALRWLDIYQAWGEEADWDQISLLAVTRHHRPFIASVDQDMHYANKFAKVRFDQ